MSDERIYCKVTGPGYRQLPVPDAFRENRGRMYETTEDPEVQGDEIVPTFAQYLDFLGHPGGKARYMAGTVGVDRREVPVGDAEEVYFCIPTYGLTGAQIRAEREAMNQLLTGAGVPWYLSIVSAQEFREEKQVVTGDGGF
jgi:hypothetical protein